ncbi:MULTISPECIES: DUF3025 domain-containing protein [unclassified Moraxella]|uniref:DUF3025 domain-containing protein n=1 Tax=unclassified Moraxella TaxID=2685852 RepID=UPI003AF676B4
MFNRWLNDISQPWYANLSYLAQLKKQLQQQLQYQLDQINNADNLAEPVIALALNQAVQQLQAMPTSNLANGNLLQNYQKMPIKFVSQQALPANTAYETFIAETGQVPTRNNLHDWLGGLIWLSFPKTKAVFNQLHQQDILENGVTAKRTAIRNVLTLFDENGGVVVSSDRRVLTALQQFDWQTALWQYRQSWLGTSDIRQQTTFFPIGHALLEKLIEPRLPICSHTLLIEVTDEFFGQTLPCQRQQLDDFLTDYFFHKTSQLTSKSFQPLPVLGIPNFCPNQSADFYQNTQVFRERQQREPVTIWQF